MRKRLDGGVHEGGCSGLGLGALESFCEGGAEINQLLCANCGKEEIQGIAFFHIITIRRHQPIMAVQSESQVVAVDNLWLCVAITLGMALVIGLAQPFAQPQMNVLQSTCFGCTWPCMGVFLWEIAFWTDPDLC